MTCPFCNKRKVTEDHVTETMFKTIYSCSDRECMKKANREADRWRR